jgi:hypothetical protein
MQGGAAGGSVHWDALLLCKCPSQASCHATNEHEPYQFVENQRESQEQRQQNQQQT